ncbi:hypothetical protein SLE2022_272240 [Rubroshorea leprosula]
MLHEQVNYNVQRKDLLDVLSLNASASCQLKAWLGIILAILVSIVVVLWFKVEFFCTSSLLLASVYIFNH